MNLDLDEVVAYYILDRLQIAHTCSPGLFICVQIVHINPLIIAYYCDISLSHISHTT